MAEIDSQDHTIVPSVLDKHDLLASFKDLHGSPIPNALALLLKTNFIPTGTVLARRTAIEEAGGFNTEIRYGEDLGLWAMISARHPITCLPEVLMLRRQHGENVTQATEPLLRDLIKVMSSLRAWDAKQLRQQGVDPNRLVAEAWGNLGYWQFSSGRLPDARQAFHSSLEEKATLRALLYSALCIMPERLVYSLRHIKQMIGRKGKYM